MHYKQKRGSQFCPSLWESLYLFIIYLFIYYIFSIYLLFIYLYYLFMIYLFVYLFIFFLATDTGELSGSFLVWLVTLTIFIGQYSQWITVISCPCTSIGSDRDGVVDIFL